jgi:hypothetical protein
MDRVTRLSPLGLQRIRVLDCLGGNNKRAPGYFEPPVDVDIFKAFATYVAQVSHLRAGDAHPLTTCLLAAGRLLTGDLAAADVVLDHLPTEAVRLDHGAGICLVTPLYALSVVLPLPAGLRNTDRWVAGSAEQAALRAWLAKHRNELRWIEAEGLYLPRPTERHARSVQPSARTVARVRHIMTCDGAPSHGNSDLIFTDGVPAIIIEWSADGDHPVVTIPLDPEFLHVIEWQDASYVYDHPIEDPRRFHSSPSIWRRLFG